VPVDLPAAFASIGIDRNYSDLNLSGLELDLQGWASEEPIFDGLMASKPRVVVEIGSWKGASIARMHALSPETTFICVDTWLGSGEHWLADDDREHLRLRGGRPTLYEQFIFNVSAIGADVFALPMTSTAGAAVLKRLGVTADLIYVDGGHEEHEVASDLALYSELLRPGGIIFSAEYHSRWPGVVRAVKQFRGLGKPEISGMWQLFRR
jgi:hypothetical protein